MTPFHCTQIKAIWNSDSRGLPFPSHPKVPVPRPVLVVKDPQSPRICIAPIKSPLFLSLYCIHLQSAVCSSFSSSTTISVSTKNCFSHHHPGLLPSLLLWIPNRPLFCVFLCVCEPVSKDVGDPRKANNLKQNAKQGISPVAVFFKGK